MRKLLVCSILLLVGILSCKKDAYEGDKAIFNGKWKWVYSIEATYIPYSGIPSTGIYHFDTIPASNYSDAYYMEFLQEGKMKFWINAEEKEKYRTVFAVFTYSNYYSQPCNFFRLFLNNDGENSLQGVVSTDSLVSYYNEFPNFPVVNYGESSSVTYRHIFVHE